MVKKINKDVKDLIGSGTTIGVGTMIVTKAGATPVIPALGVAGGMLGPIVAIKMGHRTMQAMKPMKIKKLRY